ncbi:MAG: PAS domain-containing protein [Deltaproteobacteria bacterium]|nr:PAS domain-containing protein [Deltaproteobacteria bacterium]
MFIGSSFQDHPSVLVVGPAGETARALTTAARDLGAAVTVGDSLPDAAAAATLNVVAILEGTVDLRMLADWTIGPGFRPAVLWVQESTDDSTAALALDAGADDLLRWPASAREARARLHTLVQAARGRQQDALCQALSRGKAEWEKTFDAIADSISIVGPDFVIRRANRALAQMVGRRPQELVGTRCHESLHGLGVPCPDCPVARVFETGQANLVEAETFRTRRVFDYHAYPLFDDAGRVYAALAYARDVTREEELRNGLRQSEKLMTLGQIAAGIAHEINNPLTAVSSYAQLLSLRLTDPKARESARRIEEGIDRIHRLVRNLMSFVRPSEETFYPLDVNEIVVDALSFSRYDLTRGDTRVQEALSSPLPKVLGAKDQLEHLLVNLLTNARDAVGGRGTISVSTRGDDGHVLLEVGDDGVGMGPDQVAQIFEPFFTTKARGKGTGLGLFIAAGIAKKHRGEIAVESQPGRGSRFTVILPAFRP